MKKLLSVMGSLVLSMVLLFGFSGLASAASSYGGFETDGPRYGEAYSIYGVSSGQTIKVKINWCANVNWATYRATSMYVFRCGTALSVKLYNPSTGNYTSTKVVGSDGYVTFTNMRGGTYDIYFYDSWSDYFFRGDSTATSYY
ncbi:hypothetical protein [Bacillus sp. TL12]|uniref:hypothetical protein n=1 Tax=Bacillus sp. TL12 TaxID=2894756 RepID=UPI001F51C99C|nr:hypothetical protein [Bacillus sp. TL12]MCI0768361.1 hypothetical protein [Bacillus sp. TL12]